MGKSSKKSATKVDAAPVAVAAPTKPLKKGKRDAEEIIEKQTNAKKQKKDIEEAIQKKKAEVKKTVKKAVQTSSSSEEDSSSSDSEAEQKVKVPAKKGAVPAKKLPVAAAKNGIAKKGKASSSSDESDSSDDSESDDELPKTKATAAKNGPAATVKKDESSDESDSEAETSSDEDVTVAKKKKPTAAAKNVPAPAAKEDDSSDESDSEDETSSDEDVTAAKKPTAAAKNVPAPAAKKKDDSSDESDSEDETSSDEDVTEAKKDTDVDMVDAEPTKTNVGSLSEKKAPKTPVTPKVQASGSKTLFVGNLAYSVEQADVEEFFKDAGKIVEVRFASHPDGSFKGFGHAEFETAEEAQKALQLNGQQLLGRDVRLDLAMERGAYTPQSGNDRSSNQKGERGQGPTIFVRGFGTNDEEEKIRNALNEHFGSCGDITRMSIPKDQEGGIKGVAFIDFKDSDSLNQALELDNSELGGSTLTVEEARPRGEGRDSAGGGGRGGRGGRGGGWSGGRGGRDSGGRFGGRRGGGGRGGGGRFGGGGRGRGTPSKPFGKKTTFDD